MVDRRKSQAGQEDGRVFLVVVDDSEELHQALYFACRRAKRLNGRIALMYCIRPAEFQHFAGVGELMREEAREQAENMLGANTKGDSTGPLISYLTTKGAAECPVPITIVPGNLSDEDIDRLT